MEYISKQQFINNAYTKIMMNNAFKEAFIALETIVNKYNDKKMDKRFIDFVNKMFEEKNIPVKISFDTNYRGDRENRFKLYYSGDVHTDENGKQGSLSYDSRCNYLYAIDGNSAPYIDYNSFRLNAERFLLCIHHNFECSENTINDYKESIERIDEVIKTYAELKNIIKTTLDKIPSPLRTYDSLKCPIY